MRDFEPSRTALRVAMRRAAHQVHDDPRVLDDPLAMMVLTPEEAVRIERDALGSDTLRAFVAARARFAEDQLAEAAEAGVRQLVVLGAGLDTFAYRNPHAGLRVFEVDHPATQEWKRERLVNAGIHCDAAVFVAVDFERQTLSESLAQSGFQSEKAAFFSWLGVVPYLTAAAFLETLGFVAKSPRGSGVVFDYGVARSALGLLERVAFDALSRRVESAGEPFRLFFEPGQVAAEARRLGFSHVEDIGSHEINERYFAGRRDGLRVHGGLGRLAYLRR